VLHVVCEAARARLGRLRRRGRGRGRGEGEEEERRPRHGLSWELYFGVRGFNFSSLSKEKARHAASL
jgi:hypothetical protein